MIANLYAFTSLLINFTTKNSFSIIKEAPAALQKAVFQILKLVAYFVSKRKLSLLRE